MTTKESIIHTTKELLKTRTNLTIKDITEASNINVAAVNYYFGSKDNLVNIVLKEVITELKTKIYNELLLPSNNTGKPDNTELMVNKAVDLIYGFSEEYIGVIYLSFIGSEGQGDSTNILVNEFLTDTAFLQKLLEVFSEITGINDPLKLTAKYIILFSSFGVPLFLRSVIPNVTNTKFKEYKDAYVKELVKVFTN
ncbi:MAG TPA: TetR/AcrR family transcriptional regulator [Bacilli bacterium]|nr:TetR/AcrR family transcriptional regulator [Bacilli bacterium]HQO94023.1 TetR/AcrR family transcriptional regulator [Bacilli bacterium]HQQ39614.1 TetR/AcrR family transcriptional regulator [Bacilli bacterium]